MVSVLRKQGACRIQADTSFRRTACQYTMRPWPSLEHRVIFPKGARIEIRLRKSVPRQSSLIALSHPMPPPKPQLPRPKVISSPPSIIQSACEPRPGRPPFMVAV